jgi:hypothetical protein
MRRHFLAGQVVTAPTKLWQQKMFGYAETFCCWGDLARAVTKALESGANCFTFRLLRNRGLCQGSSVVEQGTHKPLVGSSTLPPGTYPRTYFSFKTWSYPQIVSTSCVIVLVLVVVLVLVLEERGAFV